MEIIISGVFIILATFTLFLIWNHKAGGSLRSKHFDELGKDRTEKGFDKGKEPNFRY